MHSTKQIKNAAKIAAAQSNGTTNFVNDYNDGGGHLKPQTNTPRVPRREKGTKAINVQLERQFQD